MAIVNFESVAVAAEALQAAGQRASVRAVMAALGGGSPNSVLKLLGEWKAGRPVVRIADTDLDVRITDAIKVQMQRVAEQAAAAAEERAGVLDEDLQALVQAQAAAEQQITALTTERDTAQAQAQAADSFEKLKEARGEAERAAQQSVQALASLQQELSSERTRREGVVAELARAQVRLEVVPALQGEAERLRVALQASEQARQAAEQSAAVLVARLEAAERRATEADARTAKADARIDTLAHDLAGVNVALQASQARLEAAVREVGAAEATARKSAEELAAFKRLPVAVKPAKKGQGTLEL